jgi:la-related protein 1
MDAEGFIPISLLASFNRIKTLTTDLILIRDMLVLSNQAELDYTHERVRMSGNQWVAYLLPPGHSGGQQANGSATDVVTPASGATEEDDDVEIVMNTDSAQS